MKPDKYNSIELKGFRNRLFSVILDKDGRVKDYFKVNKKKETFEWQDKAYHIDDLTECTSIMFKGIIFKNHYIFFHKDVLKPLRISAEFVSLGKVRNDTKLYNQFLKMDTLKKLNDLSRPGLKLDPKLILIGMGIIAVAIYFLQGGKIGA